MQGEAQWTDIGDVRGLDPLGMLSPIEACYQSLLPGLSSVTTRLRYYSFHCWWLAAYARDRPSNSKEEYDLRARRAEALFALASLYQPGASGQQNYEQGLAGYYFAYAKLSSTDDVIDFEVEAAPYKQGQPTYLKAEGGAFGGIYAPQMMEIGLLTRGASHGRFVPTAAGLALAERFAETVGEAGPLFLSAAQNCRVGRSDLARLAAFRPGSIAPLSGEAQALRDLLLARSVGSARQTRRRDTLLAILDLASRAEASGVSQNGLRWHWMETEPDPTDPRRDTHEGWRHYQSGDTIRVVYEALLRHALQPLESNPTGRSLPGLARELSANLGSGGSFSEWLASLEEEGSSVSLRSLQTDALVRGASLATIFRPIARLRRLWSGRMEALLTSYRSGLNTRTVHDELAWIESQARAPAEGAVAELLAQRVLRRHFWVATRKFRQQLSYTYLFEIDDARLRFRQMPDVAPSGPRLGTALQFLEDVGLLSRGRITDIGREELAAA